MTPTRDELLKLARRADARTINDLNMEMLVGDLAFDLNSLSTFADLLLSAHQAQSHASDCAVHNMPARPNGECDCGVRQVQPEQQVMGRVHNDEGQGKAVLNSIGRALPDNAALYAAPPSSDQAQAEPIKGHVIANIVNRLRDIAIRFHDTQQLRARISAEIVPFLSSTPPSFDQTWNAAIARVAAHFDASHRELWTPAIAEEVRSLSRPSQAQEPFKMEGIKANPNALMALALSGALSDKQAGEILHAAFAKPVSGAVDELPPLPDHATAYFEEGALGWFLAYSKNPSTNTKALYTADQMREYAILSRAQQAPAVSDSELLIRAAAKDFYNKTVGDPAIRISSSSENRRNAAVKAGEILRAALSQPAAAPVSEQTPQEQSK